MEVGLAGALLVGVGKRLVVERLVLNEVFPEGRGLEEVEVLPVDEALAEVGVFLPPEKEFVDALGCSPYFRLTFYLVSHRWRQLLLPSYNNLFVMMGRVQLS